MLDVFGTPVATFRALVTKGTDPSSCGPGTGNYGYAPQQLRSRHVWVTGAKHVLNPAQT